MKVTRDAGFPGTGGGSSTRRAAGVFAALFLTAFSAPCVSVAAEGRGVVIGEPLPAICLRDAETGKSEEIAALLKDRVGAVVFMSTSCAVCRRELMAFKELSSSRPYLTVVAVSGDPGSPGKVAGYKRLNGLPFTFLTDPEGEKMALFGFGYTPGLVVTDRAGRIALIKSGFREEDRENLENKIGELAR